MTGDSLPHRDGAEGWRFWVDRGGTFTDLVALAPDGRRLTHKLLSENPAHYEEAVTAGIRQIMGLGSEASLPGHLIRHLKMGTTVATNALLERKGDRVLVLTTKGFGDAWLIGNQARPDLFAREIRRPPVIYERIVEIPERVSATGEILSPLDEDGLRQILEAAFRDGLKSVAIAFLHGYRFSGHEARAAEIAREIGFPQVSASHEISPLIKLIPRGETTIVDAYLNPVLRRYVEGVAAALGDVRLMFMQSSGGLADARFFRGKDSILSGPAGGIVGAVKTSEAAGFERLITFDMGGTSTDVAHYAGQYERSLDNEVAGTRLQVPMMRIHTVAAGGGSICRFDGARLRVGPESAGAEPGPASYRRGGPLTVTDCNVMLGKIQPGFFPALFGPGRDQRLDSAIVREKFAALAAEIGAVTGQATDGETVAAGFLQIAVENMANAIKKISVERGYDVTKYALVCFGGAGGQHACLVADALGIETVLIHPYAGVLSAYGMGLADIRAIRDESVERPLAPAHEALFRARVEALSRAAREEVSRQDMDESVVTVTATALVKYAGSDTALEVPFGEAEAMAEAFAKLHRRRFGFVMAEKPLILDALLVEAVGRTAAIDGGIEALTEPAGPAAGPVPDPVARRPVYWQTGTETAGVYDRAALEPGARLAGPALVTETTATTVIEPGWQGEIRSGGMMVLTRRVARPSRHAVGTAADPVMLEVFNNLFMSIAEQMGAVLANTAHSVNIKERYDFSCAIFDAEARLIANAPHIPVHLGSMGDSVAAIAQARSGEMKRGDVYVMNSPYAGGTHLPDVTVVTPVFAETGDDILFYVAARGHHADIGGLTPGSMPPHSRRIEDEGILIENFLLVENGELREAELREILAAPPYPVRNPDQNIADLKAQIAANEKGAEELNRMVAAFGLDVVRAYMGHVRENAAESVRRVLDRLEDGAYETEMDDGAKICVHVTVDRRARRARVDFSGTSAVRDNNLNAPSAICRAVVLYVFRTLVEDAIPLNAGCLEPLEIVIPGDCFLNPSAPAAVVAGNVETSECLADALFAALGALAASQGTMNNFTFGNARYQYYETIAGGAGAGPGITGASAVQTHMTNSRLTDPEVLEWRFPVRIGTFAIRRGSGGDGRYRGGDGAVREICFLEELQAAILSNRRRVAPFGLAGGRAGQTGRNSVRRADGRVEELAGTAEIQVGPGDCLIIETPGGGGYGAPDDRGGRRGSGEDECDHGAPVTGRP